MTAVKQGTAPAHEIGAPAHEIGRGRFVSLRLLQMIISLCLSVQADVEYPVSCARHPVQIAVPGVRGRRGAWG